MMAKRPKRSTSAFRPVPTTTTKSRATNQSTSAWTRSRFLSVSRNPADDTATISKPEEFLAKSTKDCAEINDQYRKLMKEESELLADLKKLQVKKQLLVKRSKQLRDEQVIKLNLDLQKEKAIRGDLEKKLAGLEKKLNQLEKEVDARNRDRQLSRNKSSDSVRKPQSSIAEIKACQLKEGGAEKRTESKSSAVGSMARTECRTARIASKTTKQSGQGQSGQRLNGSAIGAGANQINAKQANVSQSLPKSAVTANVQPKSDVQLSGKNEIKGQAFELEPKTNFIVGPGLLSLPKEQQQIRNNVNDLIRLIGRQNNSTPPNEPAGQSAANPPAANPPVNQPKTLAIFAQNSSPRESLSDSSTNVNYSPSSNSSLEEI